MNAVVGGCGGGGEDLGGIDGPGRVPGVATDGITTDGG